MLFFTSHPHHEVTVTHHRSCYLHSRWSTTKQQHHHHDNSHYRRCVRPHDTGQSSYLCFHLPTTPRKDFCLSISWMFMSLHQFNTIYIQFRCTSCTGVLFIEKCFHHSASLMHVHRVAKILGTPRCDLMLTTATIPLVCTGVPNEVASGPKENSLPLRATPVISRNIQ